MTPSPRSWCFLAAACLAGSVFAAEAPAPAAPPAPVAMIFDTDVGNDCDDALALAVIHALESRGECRLLAVTLTNPDPNAGRFIDAVNTFYGRGEIPIGVNPQSPQPNPHSAYLGAAAHYPHDFDPAKAPSALELLRRTLASADDHGVTIVQVGFFTNLAALLASPPDAISPLPGRELVAQKVKELVLMAGAFAPVNDANYFLEYNVRFDIPAAIAVARDWPTTTVWSGAEIGIAIPFPAVSVEKDFRSVARHPIQEAYQLYRPIPHERPCFDLTAVLEAVRPDRGYFRRSVPGKIEVMPDSFTRFTPGKGNRGRDRYLAVDPTQAARVREVLATLVTEPAR